MLCILSKSKAYVKKYIWLGKSDVYWYDGSGMKGQKSTLLFILTIVSLLGIGGILLTGILKSKPKEVKNTTDQKVLGEEISSKLTPTSTNDVNKFVQDTFQNTKEVAGQKVIEE